MHSYEDEKWKNEKVRKVEKVKKWKMNKAKEEKGFLRREVMQVTPSGYWPSSLVVDPCLCSYVTPSGYYPGLLVVEQHPRWNKFVYLAWNLCQPTKSLAGATSYNQSSVKPRQAENWTILPKVLDLLFTNKVHSESWSSTSVSPSVVVATTTLQNFTLALFWSLPTNLS